MIVYKKAKKILVLLPTFSKKFHPFIKRTSQVKPYKPQSNKPYYFIPFHPSKIKRLSQTNITLISITPE